MSMSGARHRESFPFESEIPNVDQPRFEGIIAVRLISESDQVRAQKAAKSSVAKDRCPNASELAMGLCQKLRLEHPAVPL